MTCASTSQYTDDSLAFRHSAQAIIRRRRLPSAARSSTTWSYHFCLLPQILQHYGKMTLIDLLLASFRTAMCLGFLQVISRVEMRKILYVDWFLLISLYSDSHTMRLTYEVSQQFHLIFGLLSSESKGKRKLRWEMCHAGLDDRVLGMHDPSPTIASSFPRAASLTLAHHPQMEQKFGFPMVPECVNRRRYDFLS
jgi:hypothetical protein